MTFRPRVSIVVVSQDRPTELKRLLVSLRFLQYLNFEVIVVTKDDPKKEFPEVLAIDRIKFVQFGLKNISHARNLGIAQASGDIVAFCDDDAVPEPTWLNHLVAPFAEDSVAAAGGFVRGRNGISFQWKGRGIDRFGDHVELDINGTEPKAMESKAGLYIKTEGTNCAFRRRILLEFGGFDENFHYFLDETDLNLRIGRAGWKTAIVPLAQVHHGFASSPARLKNRAPKSLFQIGASKAWFCKKHLDENQTNAALDEFAIAQQKRLLRYMVEGLLEPRDVPKLLQDLRSGMDAGLGRTPIKTTLSYRAPEVRFQKLLDREQPTALTARLYSATDNDKINIMKTKYCETIFKFHLNALFHRMVFHSDGYWIQTGGLFGRSERNQKLFRIFSRKSRLEQEAKRLKEVRPFALITP